MKPLADLGKPVVRPDFAVPVLRKLPKPALNGAMGRGGEGIVSWPLGLRAP